MRFSKKPETNHSWDILWCQAVILNSLHKSNLQLPRLGFSRKSLERPWAIVFSLPHPRQQLLPHLQQGPQQVCESQERHGARGGPLRPYRRRAAVPLDVRLPGPQHVPPPVHRGHRAHRVQQGPALPLRREQQAAAVGVQERDTVRPGGGELPLQLGKQQRHQHCDLRGQRLMESLGYIRQRTGPVLQGLPR